MAMPQDTRPSYLHALHALDLIEVMVVLYAPRLKVNVRVKQSTCHVLKSKVLNPHTARELS